MYAFKRLQIVLNVLFSFFVITLVSTSSIPSSYKTKDSTSHRLTTRACDNSATDRSCWGDYDTSTNYYDEVPDTGETKTFWLEISNTTLSPDGVERIVLAANGTIPGPTIEANWGDTVTVHVTNSMQNNGSTIHWHGIRQNWTNQMDGVPSITQCPIAVCKSPMSVVPSD